VLVPQIPKLAEQNTRRLESVKRLLAECAGLTALVPLQISGDDSLPAFYKLPWLLRGNNDDCGSPAFEQLRGRFLAAIRAEGVALDEGFRGFARRTNQRCRNVGDLPQARRAAAGTVILHHPVLLEADVTIRLVAHAIRKVSRALLAD